MRVQVERPKTISRFVGVEKPGRLKELEALGEVDPDEFMEGVLLH